MAFYLKVIRTLSGEVIELKKELAVTRSRPGVSQVKGIVSAMVLGKKYRGEERAYLKLRE